MRIVSSMIIHLQKRAPAQNNGLKRFLSSSEKTRTETITTTTQQATSKANPTATPPTSPTSPTPTTTTAPQKEKTIGEKLKPFLIFGGGLYLGLALFKTGSGKKKEGSVYLKELRDDFERSSARRMPPPHPPRPSPIPQNERA